MIINVIPCGATCYDCALHCSHKGGICRSGDIKHPCSQIKYNYSPYKDYKPKSNEKINNI